LVRAASAGRPGAAYLETFKFSAAGLAAIFYDFEFHDLAFIQRTKPGPVPKMPTLLAGKVHMKAGQTKPRWQSLQYLELSAAKSDESYVVIPRECGQWLRDTRPVTKKKTPAMSGKHS
jgi:hypothetical protein